MQPGSPGSGQDPYGQQQPPPPYTDPTSTPPSYPTPDPYAAPPQYPATPQYPTAPQYPAPQYPAGPDFSTGSPGGPPPAYPTSGAPQSPYGAGVPPYGYTAPGAPAGTGTNNTMGLVALITGILSIVTCWCPFLGLPLGVVGAVTGYLGKQKVDRGEANNRGVAQAGFITGLVGLGLGVIGIIASVALNLGTSQF